VAGVGLEDPDEAAAEAPLLDPGKSANIFFEKSATTAPHANIPTIARMFHV